MKADRTKEAGKVIEFRRVKNEGEGEGEGKKSGIRARMRDMKNLVLDKTRLKASEKQENVSHVSVSSEKNSITLGRVNQAEGRGTIANEMGLLAKIDQSVDMNQLLSYLKESNPNGICGPETFYQSIQSAQIAGGDNPRIRVEIDPTSTQRWSDPLIRHHSEDLRAMEPDLKALGITRWSEQTFVVDKLRIAKDGTAVFRIAEGEYYNKPAASMAEAEMAMLQAMTPERRDELRILQSGTLANVKSELKQVLDRSSKGKRVKELSRIMKGHMRSEGYQNYYEHTQQGDVNFSRTMGTSIVVETSDGYFFFPERKNVGVYPGHRDSAAAESVQRPEDGVPVNMLETALRGVKEENGLDRTDLKEVAFMGVQFDLGVAAFNAQFYAQTDKTRAELSGIMSELKSDEATVDDRAWVKSDLESTVRYMMNADNGPFHPPMVRNVFESLCHKYTREEVTAMVEQVHSENQQTA